MNQLTAFQRDVLYVVAGLGQPSGAAIKDELEDYYLTEFTSGRIYPNLKKLVDAGLLEKESRNGRTNAYSLTPRGRRVIRERREWEADHIDD